MTRTKSNIIQTSLFVVIFAALLVVASFFDLEISHILAKPYLADGAFYSTNPVGLIVEYIGSFPIFFLGIFACLIFMHHVYNLEGKRKYFAVIFAILVYGVLYYFITETVKYFVRNNGIDEAVRDLPLTIGICLAITLIAGTLMIFFYRRVKIENNKKLLRFAFVILIAAIGYYIATVIKSPIGRMRYRAMNMINDFSYYTPWYQISDAKSLVDSSLNVPNDGFKSFPSGHTYSAGVSYVLICLPYIYDKLNNVKGKIICYAIPIIYTGLVGFYRIRVGAHFMSDVLVGGTLAYIFAELGKYFLFVRKERKEEIENEKD